MTKILVCGGRGYFNKAFLNAELDSLHSSLKFTLLIEGGAKGADALAKEWAIKKGIAVQTFPADWDAYGKSAGYKRNLQMVKEGKPHCVAAFPGGKGTANMIKIAKDNNIEVFEYHD
jgi:YspA, cpYpsA-related SLOG family